MSSAREQIESRESKLGCARQLYCEEEMCFLDKVLILESSLGNRILLVEYLYTEYK